MNKNSCKKDLIHYLSVLKCLGMFAVIILHLFKVPFSYYHQYYSKIQTFISYFLVNCLKAWAVPIFIMVSGSLFLDKTRDISIKKIYSKYILRLILVLFLFGTVFAIMERYFILHHFEIKMILLSFLDVFQGNVWSHFWFIYMLIGLYIITPPLKIFINNSNDTMIKYILLVLFIFNCFIPFVSNNTDCKIGFYIPVSSIWLFYYILGYAVRFSVIEISNKLSIMAILIGVLWCTIGQFLPNMTEATTTTLKFTQSNDLIGVFMSIGIFSIAKNKCKTNANFIDSFINPISFGVYVIHMVFINFIIKFIHFTPERYNVYLVWFVLFFVTICGSILLTFLLRKIKIFRKYIL